MSFNGKCDSMLVSVLKSDLIVKYYRVLDK